MLDQNIIVNVAKEQNIKKEQVEVVLSLLSEGNTVPFIARYRKELTGALDEEQIRAVEKEYEYALNLKKRKEDVIRLIDEKGMLTDALKDSIMNAEKIVDVEDLYRPYKEKKKTKATEALALGLEPLAKMIMSQPEKGTLETLAQKFITEQVPTIEDALKGAMYIIAEWISDNASYRKAIRLETYRFGSVESKLKKNANDENGTYEMYYEYEEAVKSIRPHRILAINRGEDEKILNVSVKVNDENIINYLNRKIIKNDKSFTIPVIQDAITDSYKRLIKPSIEREIRSELTDKAQDVAIKIFSKNLTQLLMQAPIKGKMVLGVDPAYRTGCKLAVVDETGKVLEILVIYPHEPKKEYDKSKLIVKNILEKYPIELIAIGNGTASRETEQFVADAIKMVSRDLSYIIVSEAGASVYSASDEARREFPSLQVEERSAISIARRLQDPLAELVKIDPKSIGVGQYQHDVNQTKLNESLNFVVSTSVNQVGVNVNTASSALLQYVSGLTKSVAENIVNFRNEFGKFSNREDLKKIPRFGAKTYEQAIGFLRINDGENELDATPIHPESYKIALKVLKSLGLTINDLGTEHLKDLIINVNREELEKTLGVDKYTLADILDSFIAPNRDPRDELVKPLLKTDITKIEDLKTGMKLQGTIRNVVDFGAFVDIGVKEDGLVHISKLSKEYIKHPLDVVSVGDIVDVWVIDVDMKKGRVSLSMLAE